MNLQTLIQRLSTLYTTPPNGNSVKLTPSTNDLLFTPLETSLPAFKQAIIACIDCVLALTSNSTISVTLTPSGDNHLNSNPLQLETTLRVTSPTAHNAHLASFAKALRQSPHIFACHQCIQSVHGNLLVSDIVTAQENHCLVITFTASIAQTKNNSAEAQTEEENWFSDDAPDEISPAQTDIPDLTGKRILIAEDDVINRQKIAAILDKTGAQLDTVNNGLAALDTLTNSGFFDLVLMDLKMPLMDGIEATRTIRENPEWQHIPIIGLTENSLETEINMSLSEGTNEHINKPIEEEPLLHIVNKWLTIHSKRPTNLPQVVVDFSSVSFIAPTHAELTYLLNEFTSKVAEFVQPNNLNAEQTITLCRKLNELDICLALPPLQHEVNRILETNDGNDSTLLEHLLDQLIIACKRELNKPTQTPASPSHGITIEGFDCDSAIARLANKPDRYLQVLALFLKNNTNTTDELHTAIAAADWQAAQRIAHSTKGLAATIGATALAEVAAQLEHHLKSNHSVPTELNAKYVETFETTLTSIKNYLNTQ